MPWLFHSSETQEKGKSSQKITGCLEIKSLLAKDMTEICGNMEMLIVFTVKVND